MISKEDIGMITQDYRLAKDKEEQITILSQLYGTDTAEIRGILFRAGVYKIGRAEVSKALGILQKGGKNHSLGGLRLFMAAFKDCSAKDARRILIDYMDRPWEEEIPQEEFKHALKIEIKTVKIGKGEAKMIFEGNDSGMAAGQEKAVETPEQSPKEEKKDHPVFDPNRRVISHALSDEERKIIIFGLSGVVGEKDAELRKLKASSERALKRLEEAQRDYKEMKEREDKLIEDIEEIERLIDRINGSQEEKVLSADEHLWDIMANNKQ